MLRASRRCPAFRRDNRTRWTVKRIRKCHRSLRVLVCKSVLLSGHALRGLCSQPFRLVFGPYVKPCRNGAGLADNVTKRQRTNEARKGAEVFDDARLRRTTPHLAAKHQATVCKAAFTV